MIETFFFIPADKIKFINKIPEIKSDNFILDFEDSVLESNLGIAIENTKKIDNLSSFWARPKIFDNKGDLNFDILLKLLDFGIEKFILPKVSSTDELKIISEIKNINKCKFILIIESARAFVNIEKLITFDKINTVGITLGSHDLVNDLQMKYDLNQLEFFRKKVFLYAKAFGLKAIDIASMDIVKKELFKKETISGFDMGYRSKMILHPAQLGFLKEIDFFSEEEISFAKKVLEKYPNLNQEIEAIKFNGRILEKPHIKRILEILKFNKNEIK